MKFTTLTTSIYLFFFTSFLTVLAIPINDFELRDVYTPPVLYPAQGVVWTTGEQHTVTWDTSNPPKEITNGIGQILLRQGNFTTPLILANGFDILSGAVQVIVPWVLDGDDYRVVLFGDSGNFSPPFTIQSGISN